MNIMKKIVLVCVFLAGFAFLTEKASHAFCVRNKTDVPIIATEIAISRGNTGRGVLPGKEYCCSWNNVYCNNTGKRDATAKFVIQYLYYKSKSDMEFRYICTNFPLRADGWLEVSGKSGDYKCKAH